MISLVACCSGLRGQQAATNFSARFAPVPLLPALVAAAHTNAILLEGIEALSPRTNLNAGDSLTAIVTLVEKRGSKTQWLLHPKAVAPNADELSAWPPPPMTVYSSTGSKLQF